ncbi:MAG: ribosome silencing factor [Eubacteriales bacterium]|nr:ribosome silencing factor [Eubacteriales bacterium]
MDKEKIFEAVKVAYKAIDDKMGIDIKVLDIAEISPIADYFVIASARNHSQLKAMADAVEEQLYKECKMEKTHLEGMQTKSWILIDFNDIIVHLFNEEDREFYNLERIWADAKIIDESMLK